MKIEDIENAAREESGRWAPGPVHLQDIYRRDDFEAGFHEGANWRINSVWHDADIEPTEEKMLVIINKRCEIKENDYAKNKKYFASTYTWDHEVITEEITKWSYKDDLLPNTEE